MTKNDYLRLMSIIKSAYRAPWLDQEDVSTAFFNFCNRYDYDTCKNAIIGLIENGTDDGTPVTMAVIERRIEVEARTKKSTGGSASSPSCKLCGGLGYTLKTYPSGIDYMEPCPCPIGRDRFPSLFWTQEEEDEYWAEQTRKGRSKPQYMYAPPEFHRKMKYDEEMTRRYAD